MAVNFKAGYSYKITINAARIKQESTDPNVLLRVDLINFISGGSTQCNGTGIIDANGSGNLKLSWPVTSTTYTNYVFDYYSLSTAQMYLLVAAIPPSNINLQTILIRKITIEETGTPELVLEPTTLPLICGTTTAETFTVDNPFNVQNITSYEWNLGSANNGWNYNGLPADANFSTTTNSISLTPTCGSSLSNVSVTVRVNNQNYKTYSANVSISLPSLSINGSTNFCSGTSTYSINNLPCNASVTWGTSPNGIVSLSCTTCTSTTLSKIADGQTTLTATITACGIPTERNITIDVGSPQAPELIEIYGNGATDPMYLCPGGYRAEAFGSSSTNLQYEWLLPDEWTSSVSGNNNPFIVGSSGFDIPIEVNTIYSTPAFMRVRTINACGYSSPVFLFVGTDCYGFGSYSYTVFPNPAKDNIKIDSRSKNKKIREVRLIDKLGNVKRAEKYSGELNIVNLNISGLPPDVYYLKIYDGKQWETKQLRVQ
jgi:hypothetical protein